MNFFEHQDQARKNTQRLILLFSLSLAFITVSIYGVAVIALSMASAPKNRSLKNSSPECQYYQRKYQQERLTDADNRVNATTLQALQAACSPTKLKQASSWWNPNLFLLVASGTVLVIGSGSLYKIKQLQAGGAVIAAEMGGRQVLPESATAQEQQLLNVVEEMAIAAGIPVPAVYLLDNEDGINAFAAGITVNDAVIGVTWGTLTQLSRDELQGVIGHEFSHILNGDMRLNLRIVGVLHGLFLIYLLGRVLFELRSTGKEGRALTLFGLGLIVAGSIGVLCGNLIKGAISRQREFLADASAVQFTRHPAGIAGALRKIASNQSGSQVQTPYAEIHSHAFFSDSMSFIFDFVFPTHPPLAERIRRLEGRAGQVLLESIAASGMPTAASPAAMGFAAGVSTAAPSASSAAASPSPTLAIAPPTTTAFANAAAFLTSLSASLQTRLQEPQGAIAIVYGLLLDAPESPIRAKQLDWLRSIDSATTDVLLELGSSLDALAERSRLPLLELTIPALQQGSEESRQQLFKRVQELIKADGRWSLTEFAMYAVLWQRLHPRSIAAPVETATTIAPIWSDCLMLLSAVAQVGQTDPQARSFAFRSGAFHLPGAAQQVLPDTLPTCNLSVLKQSLDRCAAAAPKLRQAIVDACAHTVQIDNTVTVQEADLLWAIAVSLECSVPRFLSAMIKTK